MNVIPPHAKPFWRSVLLLGLAVLLFSIPQAALLPLLDRDEPRFAEASREMIQHGNFIVPTFNEAPRYAKPPLIYWCQAFIFSAYGEDAFNARAPSLLAVVGTAMLLFAWGTRFGSKTIGMIAAIAYAFCLQTMQQGRVATADALLVFFMTLTAYAGWRLLSQQREPVEGGSWNRWGIILSLSLAGGFLAKGPEALLPIIPLVICARTRGPRVMGSFLAMLALGLLIVAAWAIPAYIKTKGAYWHEGLGHDVGDRMVTGFQGHGASSIGWYLLGLPFYLLIFWISALPWSPLLITHRKRLFTDRPLEWDEHYLLWNAGIVFVVFSLMVTKLPHYTLPAFPFIALFFARRWIYAQIPSKVPLRLIALFGFLMAVAMFILIPGAIAMGCTPSPVGDLVRKAQYELHPNSQFALVDFQEPNAIWEMRRIVKSPATFISVQGVLPYLHQAGPRAVILSTSTWSKLSANSDPAWKTFEARGFSAAKLARVDLTLITKNN